MADSGPNNRAEATTETTLQRVRMRTSLVVVLVCVYTPYSWLLWIDHPWDDYRWYWIKMWPILPGFAPVVMLRLAMQRFLYAEGTFVSDVFRWVAGAFALAFIAALTWLGKCSRRSLGAAAAIAIVVSVPCAYVAYLMFRA